METEYVELSVLIKSKLTYIDGIVHYGYSIPNIYLKEHEWEQVKELLTKMGRI